MQTFTLKHCVWSGQLSGWPRLRSCCLFDFIFQHWPVLLIIKPDYENILESWHALRNSNINKEIWQKGHPKHSANALVNSKWIEGYSLIICLYFIILFSGLPINSWNSLEWSKVGFSMLFLSLCVPMKNISKSWYPLRKCYSWVWPTNHINFFITALHFSTERLLYNFIILVQ